MNEPHVLPLWKYFAVFGGLMALLGLTLLAHERHWGTGASLAIAFLKAALVALYFMHLRFSSRKIQIAALSGLFWLAIMLTLSLGDYLTRGLVPFSGK